MFYRGKVIVNGGVDIELPRLKRSERNEKHLFMPGTQMQTIINDSGTENNWQLILKDTRTEKRISCCFNERVILGRGTSGKNKKICFRVTSNTTVGREHCIISVRDRTAYIEDCNSVNGTFVDGKRIRKKEKLPLRCCLRLSDEVYKLYLIENQNYSVMK